MIGKSKGSIMGSKSQLQLSTEGEHVKWWLTGQQQSLKPSCDSGSQKGDSKTKMTRNPTSSTTYQMKMTH